MTKAHPYGRHSDLALHARLAETLGEWLAPYYDQRLLGIVHGLDWIEIVFDSPDGSANNLLSVTIKDGRVSEINHGFVAGPEEYVAKSAVSWEPED